MSKWQTSVIFNKWTVTMLESTTEIYVGIPYWHHFGCSCSHAFWMPFTEFLGQSAPSQSIPSKCTAKILSTKPCYCKKTLERGIASIFFPAHDQGSKAIPAQSARTKQSQTWHIASYCAEHLKDSGQISLSANPTFRRTLASAHSCCALAPPFINCRVWSDTSRHREDPLVLFTLHTPLQI